MPIVAEENLGAQMLRRGAVKTGEAVGDGTSATAIFADGVRNVVAGAIAIDLKRGVLTAISLSLTGSLPRSDAHRILSVGPQSPDCDSANA